MAKRTPKGMDRTGHLAGESQPDARGKGTDPEPRTKATYETEESGPMSKNVGKSGLQGITQAEIDATEFEQPTNASANTIKSFGSDEEE